MIKLIVVCYALVAFVTHQVSYIAMRYYICFELVYRYIFFIFRHRQLVHGRRQTRCLWVPLNRYKYVHTSIVSNVPSNFISIPKHSALFAHVANRTNAPVALRFSCMMKISVPFATNAMISQRMEIDIVYILDS